MGAPITDDQKDLCFASLTRRVMKSMKIAPFRAPS